MPHRFEFGHRDDLSAEEQQKAGLSCLRGAVFGFAAADWPRAEGALLKPLLTLDLAGLDLEALGLADTRASSSRLLQVFAADTKTPDREDPAQFYVQWVSQADFEAHGEVAPPPELERPAKDDDDDGFGPGDVPLVESVDYALEANDDSIGGEPLWPDDQPADDLPQGRFILQLGEAMRSGASVYVFEDGAVAKAEEWDEKNVLPPNWRDTKKLTRVIEVDETAPPAGSLQKWGGLPVGIWPGDWPKGMTHLFTVEHKNLAYVASDESFVDEDVVATAVFAKLKDDLDWVGQVSFATTVEIRGEDLEQVNFDELDESDMKKVEAHQSLPEKTLRLSPLSEDAKRDQLSTVSLTGPQLFPREDDRESGVGGGGERYNPPFQLTEALLPSAPGPGTLYFTGGGSYPWWHGTSTPTTARPTKHHPRGTLFDDATTAAIAVGWRIRFDDEVEPDTLRELDRRVCELAENTGRPLKLLVPGDTATDADMTTFTSPVVGEVLTQLCAYGDPPKEIDPVALRQRQESYPPLPTEQLRALGEGLEGFSAVDDQAALHLLSWGPLCYGAIYCGRVLSAADKADAKIKYVSTQDMDQQWADPGIDARAMTDVEFSDVTGLDFSDAALSAHAAEVRSVIENPKWFLLVRYD